MEGTEVVAGAGPGLWGDMAGAVVRVPSGERGEREASGQNLMEVEHDEAEDEVPASKRRRVHGGWANVASKPVPLTERTPPAGIEAPNRTTRSTMGGSTLESTLVVGKADLPLTQSAVVMVQPMEQMKIEPQLTTDTQVPKYNTESGKDAADDEEMSEDDDGSDFEIPPLVLRREFEDDEEEEEDGGSPLL